VIPDLPDERYLTWLYQQVAPVRFRNPTRTFWSLLRLLYVKEFIWFVPNDDNRVADGKALRYEFVQDEGFEHVNEEWLNMGCSVLEMLIALSRRLAFEDGGEPRGWFWHLLRNLGLNEYNDANPPNPREVNNILDVLIWRQYDRDGNGGLFPLRNANEDQKYVEIWYQMSAYLLQD
jgi:hypothetical protein